MSPGNACKVLQPNGYTRARALKRKVKKVDPAALREAAASAGGGGSSPARRRQTSAGARKVVGATSSGSRSKATHAQPPPTCKHRGRRGVIANG